MSNLIKAAEELEYVPKEDLIRMAESGDSRFPPYLVLSEIQRRTQNEKAYNLSLIHISEPTRPY